MVSVADEPAPVRVDGRLVGVVGMHGSWEWTGDVIESLIAPEAARAGLEVFVFDREGAPIYAPAKRMQALSQAGQRAPATNAAKGSPQVVDWLDGERALSANVQPSRRSKCVRKPAWVRPVPRGTDRLNG